MSISPERDGPGPEPGRAAPRIAGVVHRTPVLTSRSLDREFGCELVFKAEHLQRTGSFKFRGASHAVALLDDDCPGVATHSSGNHGAALAAAAATRGLACHVVMPDNAVASKVRAVEAYGGIVHRCAPNQAAREAGLAELLGQGFEAVPPYDDDRIIAGQGTCALELLEQRPDIDVIVAPIGGGGLLAGTTLAARASGVEVVGAEPAGADDAARSLAAGERVTDHHPETVADGLRALVGERNLEVLLRHDVAVLTVEEARIREAMEWAWSRLKQVIEPSGAVALACIAAHRDRFAGRRVGVILSGGNLDVAALLDGDGMPS
ncbi:MAG: pyridoxal-phosphate dependent enzyme [Wenzhouxiangellaceae bacterium]|nr:pyridoxal-phosphate dependent enzyme [Wenzhouxiangellaceae bacterium]